MKFEHTDVWGFKHALRGMRNPKNSWDKSDSGVGCQEQNVWGELKKGSFLCENCDAMYDSKIVCNSINGKQFVIGEKDMKLAQQLIRAGSEHRKFMRQILVSVDITAPLYWWKEFDTYKVGTVANSTSTMHKLTSQPITMDCFETNDLNDYDLQVTCVDQTTVTEIGKADGYIAHWHLSMLTDYLIEHLEDLRQMYLKTKDKRYWKELIRWLPESWLQKRTVTMTYENLLAMCSKGQRRFHKLNEWSGIDNNKLENFISWARTLPYAQEFIFIDEEGSE